MDYSHDSNVRRNRRQRSQLPRIKNKLGLLVLRTAIAVVLIGGFAAAGAGLGLYMGIIKNSPTLNLMSIQPDNYTSIIYSAKTGEELDRLSGVENRVYVTFDRIPENLRNAFLAIEDERFYSHNGIDIRGMGRAVYTLISSQGGTAQGASTITQQVIKNNLGKFDNDLISKLQEQYLAVQFEKRLAEPDMLGSTEAAKNYILEVYLNVINLGRGYYGVQSAAWNYYGKDVSELTISECATIAAITQNPSKYPPDIRPENNRERQEKVLFKMEELGFITTEEYEEALADNVYDRVIEGANPSEGTAGIVHSYYTDTLIYEVSKDLQEKYNITDTESYNWIYNKGLQIYSAQDTEIQAIVDEVFMDPENFPAGDYEIDIEYRLSVKNSITGKITNHNKTKTVKTVDEVDPFVRSVHDELLTSNDDILGEKVILTEQPQASFVLIDYYTGQVKAICGGRGEKPVNLSFNRAWDATRSPGSQFKVVASYAPALDLGRITAATVYDDAPYEYNDGHSAPYSPRNWYGRNTYEGLSTVRRGIYHSMNILAVKNLMITGIDTSFAYLSNFGFTSLVEGEWRGNRWLSDKVPSLALGGLTDGVRQVELCAAYGTIANLGEYNKPVYYTKVLDHDGNILLENIPQPRQVLKKPTAYVLTDMMRDTLRSGGTGVRAAFTDVKMPIAGKTGTSSDTKDLGFTGYTPYYVGTVWMGYDHQKQIYDNGSYHLQIWRKIMEEVHRDLPEKDFERPDGVVSASVCRDSGLLPTDLCARDPRGNRARSEIFISGTQPTDYCETHQEVVIDTTTNMIAGIYCPPEYVSAVVGFVRPEPVESSVSMPDRAYEITPEMLEGTECTFHNPFSGHDEYNMDGWPVVDYPNYDYPNYDYPSNDYPLQTNQPEFPWSTTPTDAFPTMPPNEGEGLGEGDAYNDPNATPLPEDLYNELPEDY